MSYIFVNEQLIKISVLQSTVFITWIQILELKYYISGYKCVSYFKYPEYLVDENKNDQ